MNGKDIRQELLDSGWMPGDWHHNAAGEFIRVWQYALPYVRLERHTIEKPAPAILQRVTYGNVQEGESVA